tara:strand:- start:44 stop:349 length:306 start_codon:yes stop_codon:yes gene_type:complete
MSYLKLTNVDPTYKGGAPFVLNLDYVLQFKANNNFGIDIITTASTSQDVMRGFITVNENTTTVDEVLALQKQIDDAITASPGGRVIPLATTVQLVAFSLGI